MSAIPATMTRSFDVLIKQITDSTCKNFPAIDPEDLSQEVWVELITNYQDDLSPEDKALRSYLFTYARGAAWRMRVEQLRLSAQYFYRVSDVKEILETVFDRMDWPSGYTPRDARVGERDRMAAIEVRMDSLRGYWFLPKDYKESLISRYYDRVTPERGSEAYELLWYSLRRLTENMNTYQAMLEEL